MLLRLHALFPRWRLCLLLGLLAGAYFTHHSNLGMTQPNPGIDVLGVNIGVVWTIE